MYHDHGVTHLSAQVSRMIPQPLEFSPVVLPSYTRLNRSCDSFLSLGHHLRIDLRSLRLFELMNAVQGQSLGLAKKSSNPRIAKGSCMERQSPKIPIMFHDEHSNCPPLSSRVNTPGTIISKIYKQRLTAISTDWIFQTPRWQVRCWTLAGTDLFL